jgi:PAS domain S-box-containing protein
MILPGNNINTELLDKETLRENFEKLGTIFNSLREIIFTIDIEKGVIENVTDAIETLGYQKSEWEGQQFAKWPIEKRKKFHYLIKSGSQSSVNTHSEQILFPKKNEVDFVPFEFSSVLFSFRNKKYLLCVMRDVTEREKLMHELEQSLQKEKELNELRAGFISTASHQFRTPLTVIQSSIELMEMYFENLPEMIQKPFKRQYSRIKGEVERLQTLMNDVLVLGRADARRTPFNPQSLNLIEFCQNMVQNKYNSRYLPGRKVVLEIKGKEQEVEFDAKLLDHCLENILSNAYKYSELGNIKMQIVFEFEYVTISITDEGIGIPEEDLMNLFQPFYRAGNTSDIEGTGLGLSIVKDYIDIHNGQIFVISELNVGTTVTISLPLKNNPNIHGI